MHEVMLIFTRGGEESIWKILINLAVIPGQLSQDL